MKYSERLYTFQAVAWFSLGYDQRSTETSSGGAAGRGLVCGKPCLVGISAPPRQAQAVATLGDWYAENRVWLGSTLHRDKIGWWRVVEDVQEPNAVSAKNYGRFSPPLRTGRVPPAANALALLFASHCAIESQLRNNSN